MYHCTQLQLPAPWPRGLHSPLGIGRLHIQSLSGVSDAGRRDTGPRGCGSLTEPCDQSAPSIQVTNTGGAEWKAVQENRAQNATRVQAGQQEMREFAVVTKLVQHLHLSVVAHWAHRKKGANATSFEIFRSQNGNRKTWKSVRLRIHKSQPVHFSKFSGVPKMQFCFASPLSPVLRCRSNIWPLGCNGVCPVGHTQQAVADGSVLGLRSGVAVPPL